MLRNYISRVWQNFSFLRDIAEPKWPRDLACFINSSYIRLAGETQLKEILPLFSLTLASRIEVGVVSIFILQLTERVGKPHDSWPGPS